MNLVLERLEPNSAMGQTASQDLFNATGVLLLKKGQPLTAAAGIWELYLWGYKVFARNYKA